MCHYTNVLLILLLTVHAISIKLLATGLKERDNDRCECPSHNMYDKPTRFGEYLFFGVADKKSTNGLVYGTFD